MEENSWNCSENIMQISQIPAIPKKYREGIQIKYWHDFGYSVII